MSERIFVVIDDGIVTNSIVAGDEFVALIAPDHQAVIEVTDAEPRPGKDWLYDGTTFTAPQPPEAGE